MTVDNVTQILNKAGGLWQWVMSGLGIPGILVRVIQRRYSSNTVKSRACADYYVNCHPEAEWGHLTSGLYWMKEFAAARESKTFISIGKSLLLYN